MLKVAPVVHAETFRYKLLRKNGQVQAEVSVMFKCPYCSKNHSVNEIASTPFNFSTVYYKLECGPVSVEMPWEWARKNAERFSYGKPAKILVAQQEEK